MIVAFGLENSSQYRFAAINYLFQLTISHISRDSDDGGA